MTIMGRSESEKLDLSQYFYAPMQAVDVKEIGADIPHGGMDQRKAHVLAREIFPKMGWTKPVAVHHHVLMGIAEPVKLETKDKLEQVIASKMSKSKPWTAIFIHDADKQISEKLRRAWCPEKQVDMNPVLDMAKHVVFHENRTFRIERPAKFGGTIEFESYQELEAAYAQGGLHPQDLKNAVAGEISKIISPIREYFETNKQAKEHLEALKQSQVTR
jgi:tyrosyl-tRNA synthetase